MKKELLKLWAEYREDTDVWDEDNKRNIVDGDLLHFMNWLKNKE